MSDQQQEEDLEEKQKMGDQQQEEDQNPREAEMIEEAPVQLFSITQSMYFSKSLPCHYIIILITADWLQT
jgi:hypothetical protein